LGLLSLALQAHVHNVVVVSRSLIVGDRRRVEAQRLLFWRRVGRQRGHGKQTSREQAEAGATRLQWDHGSTPRGSSHQRIVGSISTSVDACQMLMACTGAAPRTAERAHL